MPVVPELPPNMDNQEAAKWPPWKVSEKPSLDLDYGCELTDIYIHMGYCYNIHNNQ